MRLSEQTQGGGTGQGAARVVVWCEGGGVLRGSGVQHASGYRFELLAVCLCLPGTYVALATPLARKARVDTS